MKLSLALGTLLFLGCSASADSVPQSDVTLPFDPSLPAHKRDYDKAKGGLQIARIFYNQIANAPMLGDTDEVIVLWSDKAVNTTSWILNAGDNKQDFALPTQVDGSLYIYTNTVRGKATNEVALSLNTWIWNNIDQDTAYLYDETMKLIDSLSY